MYGKLGHGNEDGHSTPKKVEALKGLTISQIACGSRHTAVITLPGEVYTWGDKENGVAGHGDAEGHQYIPKLLSKLSQIKVVQLSACGFHTGCLSDNGEVFIWGEGKFGRLGHGNERNQYGPKLVEEFKLRSLDGKTPKQISCGGFHTAVCTEKMEPCLPSAAGSMDNWVMAIKSTRSPRATSLRKLRVDGLTL